MRFIDRLRVVEDILRRRKEVFAKIREGRDLSEFFKNCNLTILFFAAVYGATMGFYPKGVNILYDMLKIPMLLLVSMYVTLPTYYILGSLTGTSVGLRQMTAILLSGFTVMATVLLAFVPVNLFFILTTPNSSFQTYAFIVFLNLLIFGIGGLAGLVYQTAAMSSAHSDARWQGPYLIGLLVHVFVGTQLAWVLRPYFDGGVFIRPLEGNFYTALFRFLSRL